MVSSSIAKAQVLVAALPYIRTFYGKTIVIKYGGNAMVSQELKETVTLDIVLMKYIGLNPVIVHGGGPEISGLMKRLGKEPVFIDGLRVTDRETMEIAQMALVGKVNMELVSLLNRHGGRAVGLNGKDANLIRARKRPATNGKGGNGELVDLGFVGDVAEIHPDLIHTLNREGYIPVISSIGVGEDGESYNINADTAAGRIAAALGAEKLILLTDVEGIYSDYPDPDSLLSSLDTARARELIAAGKIEQGMIPKVEACLHALQQGVASAHIIDGRVQHALLLEIFTDEGIGTMVTK